MKKRKAIPLSCRGGAVGNLCLIGTYDLRLVRDVVCLPLFIYLRSMKHRVLLYLLLVAASAWGVAVASVCANWSSWRCV